MSDDSPAVDPRIFCFERPEAEAAFDKAFARLVGQRQEEQHKLFISPTNVLRLNHGHSWSRNTPDGFEPEFHTITAEYLIPNQAVIDNDLGVIERCLEPMSESMSRQFAQNMYGMMSKSASKAGQIVDAREHASLADGYLAVLEKISFGVDRQGQVSLPEMHLGPEQHVKVVELFRNPPLGFRERFEMLVAERARAALEAEAQRRAKFQRAGA